MSSVNKVIIVGDVIKDAEIKNFSNGNRVANLVIGTSESYKTKEGDKKYKNEYHRVSVFNKGLVSVVENYIKKGSKLYIEGQLQTRKWQDQSGQEKYTTEIVLQGYNCTLTMLDNRGGKVVSDETEAEVEQDELDDDIPF